MSWSLKELGNRANFYNMKDFGLTEEEITQIQHIFVKYNGIESAVLYGSRAKGNYKPASDIDISLKGNSINSDLQQKIEFDLDDLMLPYKFDISIYHKLTSPEFVNHIDSVGKVFYEREKILAIAHEPKS